MGSHGHLSISYNLMRQEYKFKKGIAIKSKEISN